MSKAPLKTAKQKTILDSFPQMKVPAGGNRLNGQNRPAGSVSRKENINSRKRKRLQDKATSNPNHGPAAPPVDHANRSDTERTDLEEKHQSSSELSVDDKNHQFKIKLKSTNNDTPFTVSCNKSMTVLRALQTNTRFCAENLKKTNKEAVVVERSCRNFPSATVTTNFPCCLVEKDETLTVSFMKLKKDTEPIQNTTNSINPENLVSFWIRKEGGENVKKILKRQTQKRLDRDVCVYGCKGQRIKDAMKKDGRFSDNIFKRQCALREMDGSAQHEFTSPVDSLHNKIFDVVEISKNKPESQECLSPVREEANVASNVEEQSQNLNTEVQIQEEKTSTQQIVVKAIDNSTEILQRLREQFKSLKKQVTLRENLKNKREFSNYCMVQYDKSAVSFSEVKRVKQLMTLSDSVCQLRVGSDPRGTGFLFFGRFVLTNAHVIDTRDAAEFTAVFGYEDIDGHHAKRLAVKNCAVVSEGSDGQTRLDYALLELHAAEEIDKIPRLYSSLGRDAPGHRGQICIVGHPDGGVKKMDPCFIIGADNLLEAAERHISENQNVFHLMTQASVRERWHFTENQITYDSCFFHGSSGSPVFDEDCKLIGVHTGGYVYNENSKTRSVMEYAVSIHSILKHMKGQLKIRGSNEILEILKPIKTEINLSGATEQENEDWEMEDVSEQE